MFHGAYLNRRVLVTGHSGFKGAWLALWLRELDAEVHGYALSVPTQPSLHEITGPHALSSETTADIRDTATLIQTLQKVRPQFIFHLAAQPLVRASYTTPLETWNVNVMGTAHLLEGVRQLQLPCTVVVVTSDKCYDNKGWEHGYRETDPLGGHDPYSSSKAATELLVSAWRRSFFASPDQPIRLASARGGNVIGGGDYATDRLLPDAVRSALAHEPVRIRHPDAVRPWQHILDCLSGYLWLAARLSEEPVNSPIHDAFNFGPGPETLRSVAEVLDVFHRQFPGSWTRPKTSLSEPHEAHRLHLSIDRAVALLKWHPTWDFAHAVEETAAWYDARHILKKPDMLAWTLKQLRRYLDAAVERSAVWTRACSVDTPEAQGETPHSPAL